MNKIRRNKLEALREQLQDIRYQIEDILEEEQDCLDNIPENLQGTERYEKAENAVSMLEEVIDHIDEAEMAIESATE